MAVSNLFKQKKKMDQVFHKIYYLRPKIYVFYYHTTMV